MLTAVSRLFSVFQIQEKCYPIPLQHCILTDANLQITKRGNATFCR